MNALPQVILFILLGGFVYFAYYAGFWDVMKTWDWNTWAIFFLSMLVTWIARNEFGSRRHE
jgi:hypothetical protein